jgi:hypothetical protein
MCLGLWGLTGLALAAHGYPAWLIAPLVSAPPIWVLVRCAINIWRAGVTITTTDVVVAGATATHCIPLADVQRFEPRVVHSGFGGNGTPMIVLVREGAEPIGIYALSRQGFVWRFKKILRALEPVAAQLNLTLARARTADRDGAVRPTPA